MFSGIANWTFNIVDVMLIGAFFFLVGWSMPKIERKEGNNDEGA